VEEIRSQCGEVVFSALTVAVVNPLQVNAPQQMNRAMGMSLKEIPKAHMQTSVFGETSEI
jgi:hypothetical protein